MDDEGVEIGVEEAILEANEEDTVDGIMVYYPIYGGSQVSHCVPSCNLLSDLTSCISRTNIFNNVSHPSRTSRDSTISSSSTCTTSESNSPPVS